LKFATGLEVWLARPPRALRRARIGLVSHAAAVGADGVGALDRLCAAGLAPRAVFAPEHGYWAAGGAGEVIRDDVHPLLRVPIHSLYGARRAPAPEMLDALDLLLVDLQDLAVRCYTYVSTLRDILEAAAAAGKPVIVADRPDPLAAIVDGPMLDPAHASFVGRIPAPFVYGMTIGETARWLAAALHLDLDLRIAPMRGYRADGRRPDRAVWLPPSPGIRTWESAWCYPATVFCEALPLLRADRGGPLSFQVAAVSRPSKTVAAGFPRLGRPAPPAFQALETGPTPSRRCPRAARAPSAEIGPWEALEGLELPGARLCFHRYRDAGGWIEGARIAVTDPAAWRPAEAAVRVLERWQRAFGAAALWEAPGARPEFFDRLLGEDRTRAALQAGRPADAIVRAWCTAERRAFERARANALLYERPR